MMIQSRLLIHKLCFGGAITFRGAFLGPAPFEVVVWRAGTDEEDDGLGAVEDVRHGGGESGPGSTLAGAPGYGREDAMLGGRRWCLRW